MLVNVYQYQHEIDHTFISAYTALMVGVGAVDYPTYLMMKVDNGIDDLPVGQ